MHGGECIGGRWQMQNLLKRFTRRPCRVQSARPLLNVGCGRRRHAAWVNADLVPDGPDVVPFDIRHGLPFMDRAFDAVYASHVLEHLSPRQAATFLREVRRVLRPGGVVRIVVPDLEGIAREYLESLGRASRDSATDTDRWQHRWMIMELLDQMVRNHSGGLMGRWWASAHPPGMDFVVRRLGAEVCPTAVHRARESGPTVPPATLASIMDAPEPSPRERAAFARTGERHQWMYDRVSLADLLEMVGFEAPRATDATRSSIPAFATYLLDADEAGQPHKPDSLYMEAFAPAADA